MQVMYVSKWGSSFENQDKPPEVLKRRICRSTEKAYALQDVCVSDILDNLNLLTLSLLFFG